MNWNEVLIQSLYSALISGSFALLISFLVEKFGGRTGGLIATIPWVFLPASYSMLTASSQSEAQSSLGFVGFGNLNTHL